MSEPRHDDPVARARWATEFVASRARTAGLRLRPFGERSSFTTIELKTNFLSSARLGERVACRCTSVHLGRQTHVWDATVTNETTGRTMALFRCTQMVLQPK